MLRLMGAICDEDGDVVLLQGEEEELAEAEAILEPDADEFDNVEATARAAIPTLLVRLVLFED